MAYRFRRKESAVEGFRRIVREQTASAVSLLADDGGELAERIHEARRCLKRLRTILRFAHGEMDEAMLEAMNMAFRDAGRKLSGARDAQVSLQMFEGLASKVSVLELEPAREFLQQRVQKTRRRALSANQLADIATKVRTTGQTLAQLELVNDDWLLVGPGLARSYRSARRSADTLKANPDAATLHEWRKHVKHLFFQMELLRRALPKLQRKLLPRLFKLGEVLGEHHDLHTLQTGLAGAAADFPGLDGLIADESQRRVKRARRLARTAFCERVNEFVTAVHAGWKKWRKPAP